MICLNFYFYFILYQSQGNLGSMNICYAQHAWNKDKHLGKNELLLFMLLFVSLSWFLGPSPPATLSVLDVPFVERKMYPTDLWAGDQSSHRFDVSCHVPSPKPSRNGIVKIK